jgi:hypothetical protein
MSLLSTGGIVELKTLTDTIFIVFVIVADPVGLRSGQKFSAAPGGKATGSLSYDNRLERKEIS